MSKPEWRESLDGDSRLEPGELAQNLDDLRAIKGWLGYGRELWRELPGLLGPDRGHAVFLDVATGGADVPTELAGRALRAGLDWRIAALDRHPQVAADARRRAGPWPGVGVLRGDALRLPLPDRSVDVALCSYTLHHFDWEEAIALLLELQRVARRGLIVSDFVYSAPAWWAARALAHLWGPKHRLSRRDGPLSVRRAYTQAQMRRLAEEAGLASPTILRHFPSRITLLAPAPASLQGKT